jgi:hypothetical protein
MLSSRKGGMLAAIALGLSGLAYAAQAVAPSLWAQPTGPTTVGGGRARGSSARVQRQARKARHQAAHRAACKRKGR